MIFSIYKRKIAIYILDEKYKWNEIILYYKEKYIDKLEMILYPHIQEKKSERYKNVGKNQTKPSFYLNISS